MTMYDSILRIKCLSVCLSIISSLAYFYRYIHFIPMTVHILAAYLHQHEKSKISLWLFSFSFLDPPSSNMISDVLGLFCLCLLLEQTLSQTNSQQTFTAVENIKVGQTIGTVMVWMLQKCNCFLNLKGAALQVINWRK